MIRYFGIDISILTKNKMKNKEILILGSKISCISSYEEAYNNLLYFIKNKSPEYITVNNVHTITNASIDISYKKILNDSGLSIADGKPLSVVAKLKGIKNIQRIFGPTLFEFTLENGLSDNISHFFFGSSLATLNMMELKLKEKYPLLKIAGKISPPFRDFTERENDDFIDFINSNKPDIVWVSLGAPKQEKWIYENYLKLEHGIMIGIGAGFDYLAGNTMHAPNWMKNLSLEWVYRLIQEPRRLWKRYLITNTIFIVFALAELLKIKTFEK